MPNQERSVAPEVAYEYKGVRVFHTYENGDYLNRSSCWFTLNSRHADVDSRLEQAPDANFLKINTPGLFCLTHFGECPTCPFDEIDPMDTFAEDNDGVGLPDSVVTYLKWFIDSGFITGCEDIPPNALYVRSSGCTADQAQLRFLDESSQSGFTLLSPCSISDSGWPIDPESGDDLRLQPGLYGSDGKAITVAQFSGYIQEGRDAVVFHDGRRYEGVIVAVRSPRDRPDEFDLEHLDGSILTFPVAHQPVYLYP